MDNANSKDYLEKIKTQVIENLKRTAFAPSVQMTDVPRDPEGMDDEADAMLDDLDEDQNKDTRYTKRRWDKYVSKDEELSESEGEDQATGLDVRNRRSRPKRRNIMDNRIVETRSVIGTVDQNGEASGTLAPAAEVADTTVGSASPTEDGGALVANAPDERQLSRKGSTDPDGDVDMDGDVENQQPTDEGNTNANDQITPPMSPTTALEGSSVAHVVTPPTNSLAAEALNDIPDEGSTLEDSSIAAAAEATRDELHAQ